MRKLGRRKKRVPPTTACSLPLKTFVRKDVEVERAETRLRVGIFVDAKIAA